MRPSGRGFMLHTASCACMEFATMLRQTLIVEQNVSTRCTRCMRCPTPVDGGNGAGGWTTTTRRVTPAPVTAAPPRARQRDRSNELAHPTRRLGGPRAQRPLAKHSVAALATCESRPHRGRRSRRTPTRDDGRCGQLTTESYAGRDTHLWVTGHAAWRARAAPSQLAGCSAQGGNTQQDGAEHDDHDARTD
jgi:hypothetical protein